MAYTVEVGYNEYGFRFRLVKDAGTPDQRNTCWAGYESIVMLDDMAAFTGYYAGTPDAELVPLTASKVLSHLAVMEEH